MYVWKRGTVGTYKPRSLDGYHEEFKVSNQSQQMAARSVSSLIKLLPVYPVFVTDWTANM